MQTNQGALQGTIGAPTFYGISVNDISVNDLDGKLTVLVDDSKPIKPGCFDRDDQSFAVLSELQTAFSGRNLHLNSSKFR